MRPTNPLVHDAGPALQQITPNTPDNARDGGAVLILHFPLASYPLETASSTTDILSVTGYNKPTGTALAQLINRQLKGTRARNPIVASCYHHGEPITHDLYPQEDDGGGGLDVAHPHSNCPVLRRESRQLCRRMCLPPAMQAGCSTWGR